MLFSATACREAPPPPPAGTGAARFTLETHPAPPVALEKTTFLVTARDAGGTAGEKDSEKDGEKPITGARMLLDLSMPGMYHGPNRPECAETEPGAYLCQGYLVMPGEWEIVVEVEGKEAAVFRIEAAGRKPER